MTNELTADQSRPQILMLNQPDDSSSDAYSFEGVLIVSLLVICTCAYMRRIPRLRQWFLSERKGFMGVFFKASVVGTRLHIPVALVCTTMAFYVMFIK